MDKWYKTFLVAATYIGTIVGAGFATGKEIVIFFSMHGPLGTIGILLSGSLFILMGTKIMIISAQIQAYSYQQLNEYLFGNRLGKLINGFIFIVVISITAVMLSGAGALFREQLYLPHQLGIIMTLVLCYLIVRRGISGIFVINAYLVPILIIFCLFIGGVIFSSHSHLFIEKMVPHLLLTPSRWFVSAITYVSFNLMAAQVVLVPLGTEIKDEQILKWGGFFGGFGLCLLLLLSHFSLSVFPNVFEQQIPMAGIVKHLGVAIHFLFIFIIYGEIFNTVVGNVFGMTRQLKAVLNIQQKYTMLFMMSIIFFISQINYGKLLTILYPLFGYISLIFLLFLLIKKVD